MASTDDIELSFSDDRDYVLSKLKLVREEKSLSQEDLARHLGIDRTTYVRKESGRIPVTTEEWLKISHLMEEEVAVFFSDLKGDDKANGTLENDNGSGHYKDEKEALLVRLYRSLNSSEKGDVIFALFLVLKRVRRRKVQETLKMLVR